MASVWLPKIQSKNLLAGPSITGVEPGRVNSPDHISRCRPVPGLGDMSLQGAYGPSSARMGMPVVTEQRTRSKSVHPGGRCSEMCHAQLVQLYSLA
jgi:hypothetical protein